MWDKKRKKIWLTVAVAIATIVVYQQAFDDDGKFDIGYFALLELIFIAAIAGMFYFYSRNRN